MILRYFLRGITRRSKRMFWAQVGDSGASESFGDLPGAVAYLNTLAVGKVAQWVDHGFDTPNYHGDDRIRLFYGLADGQPKRGLTRWERAYVEQTLKAALN